MKYLTEADYQDKYPKNISEQLISFDCGIGWKSLIDRCMEAIKDTDIKVEQVKEKFGGLRFYVDSATDDIYKVIESAESESFLTCESCGTKENVTTEGGWLKTLCKSCRG